jgi:RNA polymerase sigma factor (TIGR02999 family)
MQAGEVTVLLERWKHGDDAALSQLTPLVYPELRRIAARYLRNERKGHTLQSTGLVHEAYLRLLSGDGAAAQTRNHFFAIASQIFRRILIDHARKRDRYKRGGATEMFVLNESIDIAAERGIDLLRLDDALQALAVMDARQSRIVELKFFGGLEIEEIAEVTGVSPATVKRDWATARAWLLRELV